MYPKSLDAHLSSKLENSRVKISPDTLSPCFHSVFLASLDLLLISPCYILLNFFQIYFLFTQILSPDMSIIFSPSVGFFLMEGRSIFYHLHF